MRRVACFGWLILAASGMATVARGEDPARAVLIGTNTSWRMRLVNESEEILTATNGVVHGGIRIKDAEWYAKNPQAVRMPEDNYTVAASASFRRTPRETPADWMTPEFDDSEWVRQGGALSFAGSDQRQWKAIFARTRFSVDDPAKVSDLRLDLSFVGGAVVYLNGKELARSFLPARAGDLHAPAEAYPDEAYFTAEGYAVGRKDKDYPEIAKKRVRRIEGVAPPAGALRKGVNTLAISAVRAPSPARWLTGRIKAKPSLDEHVYWGHLGLIATSLTAASGEGVRTNAPGFSGQGFQVWNLSILNRNAAGHVPDGLAPLHPVRLIGVRNGMFAGTVGVGDDKPMRKLTATPSELKHEGGKGSIAETAIEVRYMMGDYLEDEPAAEYAVQAGGRSFAPLWFRVRVPDGIASGEYRGAVTVAAEETPAREVPLRLYVADWTLPPVADFHTMMDYIQSPESLAMAYKVPLWSDAHFKLLDRTFGFLAELGCKTLFITAIRRTHFGNDHAMLRWVMDDEGELTPDFSIVEKYLDVAQKRLGKIPAVIFCCWEPAESEGHADLSGQRILDKKAMITVVDPKTGELYPRTGPAWGTPEAKEFWGKAGEGFMAILKKRGLENSLLFGLIGDARPSRQAMMDITTGFTNAQWAAHSHFRVENWQGFKVGLGSALWGISVHLVDPATGYGFGWSSPWTSKWRLTLCARELRSYSDPLLCRTITEKWMGGWQNLNPRLYVDGVSGLSRVGVDFWPVVGGRASLAGRFPEACWGQLNLNNFMTAVLGQGRKGAVPTLVSEQFRENIQELEARVFLEKVWLDKGADEIVGPETIQRIRNLLDERIRFCLYLNHLWFVSSGWTDRNRALFDLAGEVAAKYGERRPNPNLTSRNAR